MVTFLLTFAPCSAQANDYDPPYPSDLQADVHEPDATVSIVIPSRSAAEEVDIVRSGPAGIQHLGTLGWDLGEPAEIVEYECEAMGWADCPDYYLCVDCDEDGVPECSGFCVWYGRFELEDTCVPVSGGSSEVVYYAQGETSWDLWTTYTTVDVEWVDSCQDTPDLPWAPDDPAGDPDDPGSAGMGQATNVGCRMGHRPLTTPSLLTATMALVGLGLLVGWRRSGP